jgi:uncharacterized protein (TIGR00161 family)
MKIEDQVIIENGTIEIKKNSTILFGLAGVGLIGPIIANTLIEQIEDMEQLGFITSEDLPPIAVFYDGVLRHPFRLFYSHKHNLIVAICEVPFQTTSAYNGLSKVLCKWALSDAVEVKEIVTFQGIPKKGEIDEFPVYFAAESDKAQVLENIGIKKLKKGIIVGPEATFLNQALTNKLQAYALFTPVSQYPTPEGAAAIIESLNKIYNLEVDTTNLINKGKKIKKKMLDLAEKAQEYQRKQLGTKKERYDRYFQ